MKRAETVNAKDIVRAARKAAEGVLDTRSKALGPVTSIGVFPDIGVVGLIWRNPPFKETSLADLHGISADMTKSMGGVARGGRPAATIFDDYIVAGYFPVGPIDFGEFQ